MCDGSGAPLVLQDDFLMDTLSELYAIQLCLQSGQAGQWWALRSCQPKGQRMQAWVVQRGLGGPLRASWQHLV